MEYLFGYLYRSEQFMGQKIDIAQQFLSRYWGYDQFRQDQIPIIEAAMMGVDVLALLPTGGGKSICYQVPGMVQDGLTLVISPLIALMDDQVTQLRQRGIRAYKIHSGGAPAEHSRILDNCINGPVKFLYISPERLLSSRFKASLPFLPLSQVAVDEAHCISQWGHDFRPAYLQIGEIRNVFPKVPIRAFTATATQRVRQDIISSLGLRQPLVYLGDIYRSNLDLKVKSTGDRTGDIMEYCKAHRGDCGIIYVRNRKACMELAEALRSRKLKAAAYHAGLDQEVRSAVMESWMRGDIDVVVATNAFGMGIDKADVRFVLHVEAPPDLESYYQEAGRAGRDGARSEAILFSQPGDDKKLYAKWSEQYIDVGICQKIYKQLAIDFQVAEGDLPEASFPLDIREISQKLGLSYKTVFYGIRLLQLGGWIEWSDSPNDRKSMLHIHATPGELPEHVPQFPFIGDLLRWVLRLYEGVLSMAVPIDESALSKQLQVPESRITDALLHLQRLEMAVYHPSTGLPTFRFTVPRLRASSLELNDSKVAKVRQWQEEKLNKVFLYLKGESCLYHQLAKYFDVPGPQECGHCSACRSRSHKNGDRSLPKLILALLKEGEADMDALMAAFGDSHGDRAVFKAIGHLLEEEAIILSGNIYRCKL